MTNHTPGEWDITDNGHQVIQIDDMGSSVICDLNTGLVNYKVNARLLASAPRLLVALKRLVARIDHNGGIGEYKGGPAFVMKDAREALSKAEAL